MGEHCMLEQTGGMQAFVYPACIVDVQKILEIYNMRLVNDSD